MLNYDYKYDMSGQNYDQYEKFYNCYTGRYYDKYYIYDKKYPFVYDINKEFSFNIISLKIIGTGYQLSEK